MSKQRITGHNDEYRKKDLVRHITDALKEESVLNEGWEGLPDCDESYLCLDRLNKTILIKIYESLMRL